MRNIIFNIKNSKGQTALEYTVLMIIVAAALLTIGNYFKRGMQGKWKSTVDGMGDQYDPRFSNVHIEHTMETVTETEIKALGDDTSGWWTFREDVTNVTETKRGNIVVGSY